MREEEMSWLSWDADDVSTLPDMAALWMSAGVCCIPAEDTGGGELLWRGATSGGNSTRDSYARTFTSHYTPNSSPLCIHSRSETLQHAYGRPRQPLL